MRISGAMLKSLFLLWACVVPVAATLVSGIPFKKYKRFDRCDKTKGIYPRNIFARITAPRLRCFAACSADDRCKSVNVCPSSQAAGQWDCQLLDRYSPWFCRGLNPGPHPDCFHAEKASTCDVKRRPGQSSGCVCELCSKGPDCNDHVIDCAEAKSLLGGDVGYDTAVCPIQPTTATTPFPVLCGFTYGTTNILRRVQNASGGSQLDWPSYGWDDYVAGLGDPYHSTDNFFVGLENMRLFLNQMNYRLNMWNTYHEQAVASTKSPSFRDVKLDRDLQYAFSYTFYSAHDGSENSESPPPRTYESFQDRFVTHLFCTADRDCGGCASAGGPGWYFVGVDGSCKGTSPFAFIAKWPQDSGLLTLASTDYNFERA